MTIAYTKKSGQWVVIGLASEISPGPVEVTKRDGSKKSETITSVGAEFDGRYGANKGKACRYGYLAAKTSKRASTKRSGCHCGSRVGIDSEEIVYATSNCSSCNFDAEHG